MTVPASFLILEVVRLPAFNSKRRFGVRSPFSSGGHSAKYSYREPLRFRTACPVLSHSSATDKATGGNKLPARSRTFTIWSARCAVGAGWREATVFTALHPGWDW